MISIEEYLQNGGDICPECQAEDVTAKMMEVDGMTAWQPVYCKECGAEWTDVYELQSYEKD